ncbi:MAG: metallophosphoesterase, partial [Paenibacillus sp. RIFOXYA1_FULL_44_5]
MQAEELIILHTNDIHSHFEQMPKIASAIQQYRDNSISDSIVVVDCGDHIDRMRIETEGSEGSANIQVMNAVGYDMITLGNNEGLTLLPDVLQHLYRDEASFKVILSNLYDQTGQVPDWIYPSYILDRRNVKVGFIGITAAFQDFYELLGWNVTDPIVAVREQVEIIRKHADIVILISHVGIAYDKRIAQEIEGIDVILGGHTHHLFEVPERINQTYLCAAGKFGQYLGTVKLTINRETKALIHVAGEAIPVEPFAPHPQVEAIIEKYRRISTQNLDYEVACLDEPLHAGSHGESPLGSLLASGLRKWTGADIGLANVGQLIEGLEPGSVTKKKLLEICPSPINPCLMLIRGEDIAWAIEQSLTEEYRNMPIRGFGFRGKILGVLCLDGLKVEYDPMAEPFQKVKRIWVNQELLHPHQSYRVGTIDMFTFRVGYLSLKKGKVLKFFLPE